MSGGVTAKSNITFEERMSLVRKGAVGSMQRQISASEGAPVMTSLPRQKRRQWILVKILAGFAVGFGALLIGKLAVFHLVPDSSPAESIYLAGLATIGDKGVGLALALMLMILLALKPLMAKASLGAGYATLLYGETDVASRFPEMWGTIFSPGYAAEIAAGEQVLPQLLALTITG